jgi:hypothetical protein
MRRGISVITDTIKTSWPERPIRMVRPMGLKIKTINFQIAAIISLL